MKIGFYSQNFSVLGRYWEKLKELADCWWGVPEKRLYETLIKKGVKKLSFYSEKHIKDYKTKKGNQFISTDPLKFQKKIADEIDPDVWIADTPNLLNVIPRKVPKIQTLHSLPIKKHVFYKPVLDYDLILLPGQYHKDQFINRFNLDNNDERLQIVGWPRIDNLICNNFDRDKIMEKIGLDRNKKTIMYAPTWGWGAGNNNFFCRWFDQEIKALEKLCKTAADENLNFIIRLHSLSFSANNKALIDITKKYNVKWQTTETSNFQDDPNEYLWITDILISDLSGIISEFMVLDRPIIYIDPDENNEPWKDSDMPKDFRAGHIVKDLEQLSEVIKDCILYPSRHSEKRKNFISKIYSNVDGKAIERATSCILKFVESKGIKL